MGKISGLARILMFAIALTIIGGAEQRCTKTELQYGQRVAEECSRKYSGGNSMRDYKQCLIDNNYPPYRK